MFNNNLANLPSNPLPFDIPHGKYVSTGELIRDDADGIGHHNVVQNLVVFLESPRITKYVTAVRILGDNFLGDPRSNSLSHAVTDYA